jgi:hypothetical protein
MIIGLLWWFFSSNNQILNRIIPALGFFLLLASCDSAKAPEFAADTYEVVSLYYKICPTATNTSPKFTQ